MSSSSDELAGAKGSVPTCERCGSMDVVRDAFGRWNPEVGQWELQDVYDNCFCRTCEENSAFVWIAHHDVERNQIAFLNDQLRRYLRGNGSTFITQGIVELGQDVVLQITTAIRTYDQFTEDNDPHGEHDFGSIIVGSEKVFWKIDYYDQTMVAGSPNPADGNSTHRVLTIMLASEY